MAITADTIDGHTRVLTLDRPEVLNALRVADLAALHEHLTDAEGDPAIRCVVLTGAGDMFCSGNDIHEMQGASADQLAAMERKRREPTWHWAEATVPTIVAINGGCYGIGTILAAAADLRIGSPGSRIKVSAVTYGGANLTWALPTLIGGAHARDLLLTGRAVGGDEAYRMGLLNRLVPDGDVLPAAVELAGVVATNPAAGPRAVKRLIHEAEGLSRHSRFEREHAAQLEQVLAGATEGAFAAFLDRSAQRRAERGEPIE